MPPSDVLDLTPPLPIQELGEPGQEGELVELHHSQQHFSLRPLHLSHLPLLHPLPEAHEQEQGKHGVVEVLADTDAAGGLRLGNELAEQKAEGPCPVAGVGLDAGGVEDFRRDVAPEEAPLRAIAGGGDAGVPGSGRRGPVGEGGAAGN